MPRKNVETRSITTLSENIEAIKNQAKDILSEK